MTTISITNTLVKVGEKISLPMFDDLGKKKPPQYYVITGITGTYVTIKSCLSPWDRRVLTFFIFTCLALVLEVAFR